MNPMHHDSDQDDQDKETCELCLISLQENKEIVAVIPELNSTYSIEKIITHSKTPPISSTEDIRAHKLYESDNFNKPPPVIMT